MILGVQLCDNTKGILIEVATGEPSFYTLYEPLQKKKQENSISQTSARLARGKRKVIF